MGDKCLTYQNWGSQYEVEGILELPPNSVKSKICIGIVICFYIISNSIIHYSFMAKKITSIKLADFGNLMTNIKKKFFLLCTS